MSRKTYIDRIHPDIYKSLNATVRTARKTYEQVGLPQSLVELVNVRVSQINGCPTCLSIHVPAARAAGVDTLVLDLLPSWRQDSSATFSAEQCAALQLAEALTQPFPGAGPVSVEQAVAEACREFDDEQVSALQWAIVLINAYNRISIGSSHPPIKK